MRRDERSGSALEFQAFIFAESDLDWRSQSRHAPVSSPASHTGNFLASRIGHPLLGGASGVGVGPKLPPDTGRVESKPAQMEIDGILEALAITESPGSALDPLNDGV
jgi:hypothetical protein